MKLKIRHFPFLVVSALIVGCGGSKQVELKRTVGNYKLIIKAVPDGMEASQCDKLIENAADTFKKRLDAISGTTSVVDEINFKRDSVHVSPDVYGLLAKISDLTITTGGRWNPFLGELRKLWGIGETTRSQPNSDTLEAAFNRAMNTKLILLGEDRVGLTGSGSLYIGRAAVGWALDEAAGMMLNGGVESGFLVADGVYRYWGTPSDRDKWRVDVNALPTDSAAYVIETDAGGLCEINLRDLSSEGNVIINIIYPFDGELQEGMINLTVWTPDAMQACILAETMYSMDRLQILEWSEAMPEVGVFFIQHQEIGVIGEANSRMSGWVSRQ